jgi:GNAT superfamily N-acetyltransferase
VNELACMESAYREVFRQVGHVDGVEWIETSTIARVRSSVPTPWLNIVLSTQAEPPEQPSLIASLVGESQQRGTPLLWRLGPATPHRATLGPALREAGFHPAPPSTALIGHIPRWLGLWRVLPVRVRGEQVADDESYREWFDVFAAAFGVPAALADPFTAVARGGFAPEAPVQNLRLLASGRTVACCTTLWSPDLPFASVFNFAVAPDQRRSGWGRYLLAFAAYHLRDRGCRTIGQFSTPEGAPFYERVTATRRLGTFDNWIWVGP